jgi:hypothetical protein
MMLAIRRRTFMKKKFLAFVALATLLAAPAFAQQASGRHDNRQQSSSSVHPYAADRYAAPQYETNNNANSDFQLGGER